MRLLPGKRSGTLSQGNRASESHYRVIDHGNQHFGGIVRAFRKINHRVRSRTGLTLVEMALATVVATTFSLYVTLFISGGIQAQVEAERMSIAASLAQTKMSQLLSAPTLEPTASEPQPHKFGRDAGIYEGYEVTVIVRQDKINLQDTLSSGEVKSIPVDDKLPAGVQNQEQTIEKAGSSEASVTGGDVNVHRIVIDIKVPLGPNSFRMYRVETLRSADKPTEMGTP
ncbi:MAG: hypothetical protein CMN77_05050 [Spirochaetaceae bacterium]|nr:hypothetical protein [Spirochaetaceae bacterium]|tara:strand:- start:13225 stop:13905 length:681 start_codon:yes stop_codon:yes gene_type:complete